MKLSFSILSLVSFFLLPLAAPALAGDPVALVEEISTSRSDIMVMDFLEEGQAVTLAADETLVISYLDSCTQETITGGTVTIGRTESSLQQGSMKSRTVLCDSNPVVGQADTAGAVVFRDAGGDENLPKPGEIIYSTYPFFQTDSISPIAFLKRIDKPGKNLSIILIDGIADFRVARSRLESNGLYKISTDDREIVFLVHSSAKSSETSLLSRLVRF